MVIIMDVHSSDHGHGCLPIVTNDSGNLMNANIITTGHPTITNIMILNQPPPSPQTPKKSLGILAEAAALKRQEDLENQKQLNMINSKINNNNNNNTTITTEQSSLSSNIVNEETATTTNQTYTLKQVKKFSDKRLITTFVEYKKDIKTKRCSYRCQMLPLECQCKFDSCIGADQQSKTQVLEHIRSHLCNLETTMPNIKLSSFRKKKIRKNNNKNKTKTGTTTGAIATTTNISNKLDSSSGVDQQNLKLDYTCCKKMTNVPMIVDNNNKIVEIGKINFGDIVESKNFVTVINQQPPPPASVVVANAAANTNVPATTQSIIETPASGVISSDLSLMSLQQSPNSPASQAKMRELALIYIDDIRKKNSSSTSKSVIKNGSKKNVIHQCNFCPDKQFTSLNGLVFHYKKHAGLKPYVCDRCGATFTRQHSLNYHTLIHLNKSRFNCPDCSRRFRHPSHFKEHMRRHTGETPFQCEDCLIRFKTRNTYKRHLQTKHSKILTSKGIIELSDSYQNNNNNKDPNKKTPKVIASKTGGSTKKSTINQQQASTSTINVNTITKPRRKYAINSLYKNIETQNKFEQQQFQQHPTAATLIAHTTANPAMLAAVQADSCHHVLASHHHGQQTAIAATAQTAPGSNITILSVPVHILDNNGGSTAPIISTIPATTGRPTTIARKTLLNYNNFNQIATSATALAAGGQPTNIIVYHQQQHPFHRQDENGKTVLTPIQITTTNPANTNTNEPTFIIKTESDQTSCNLMTELTTAPPLMSNTATYTNRLNHPITIKQEDGVIISQPSTAMTAPPNNDNFMRLLEAIEITEEGKMER